MTPPNRPTFSNPPAPAHLPSAERIAAWPAWTPNEPLRVLVSGCLAGSPVGYVGSTYGRHPHIARLLALPNVRATIFCPEDFAFGTPRALCDIRGGDGHDVLGGRAKVLTAEGVDWTAGMLRAAGRMLQFARENEVHLAILMDISAACGSQVIYAGGRPEAPYQAARGVCSALLQENGIAITSQRDFRTLGRIFRKLGVESPFPQNAFDHHETEWYRHYFSTE